MTTGPGLDTVTISDVCLAAAAAGLRVRSSALSPAADANGASGPPPVPGFVHSSFSPLVADAAHRCLAGCYGDPPAPQHEGRGTGIVIVSRHGDVESAAHVARAVDTGQRVGPLLFYQSVPNAVAGHLAAAWCLRGPVLCLSPASDAVAQGMRAARLLLADGDAQLVLAILVEQACVNGGRDRALCVLLDGRAAC